MIFMLNPLGGPQVAAPRSLDPPSCYSTGSTGIGSGAVPVRLYFTRPRRTSSVAITVGFFEDVGSTGRAPPCNCRARFADTMINRYVLCSGSSGSVQCELLRGALSAILDPSSNLKCL